MHCSPRWRQARSCGPRGAWFVLIGVLIATSGCGSADSTPPVFAAADLPVTVVEFRIRLNDFADYFVAEISEAAEVVIDNADDQMVRRRAMEFRSRTVGAFVGALIKPDPVASLIDAWAFCLQLRDYVAPGGAGGELFGPLQSGIQDATQNVVVEMEDLVWTLAQRPTPAITAEVSRWADEHPLTSAMMARRSTAVLLAEQLATRDNSPLAALGRLQLGIDDLVAQGERYISIVPRAVRWQAQLIVHETLYDELALGEALDTLDLLDDYLVELSAFAEEIMATIPDHDELEADLDEALAALDARIELERARLIEEVERQREMVFADVSSERQAIMRDVEAQIEAATARIEANVDEVFARIELLVDETLQQSTGEGERLINLVFWRSLTLLLVAIGGGVVLIVLNRRLRSASRTAEG